MEDDVRKEGIVENEARLLDCYDWDELYNVARRLS